MRSNGFRRREAFLTLFCGLAEAPIAPARAAGSGQISVSPDRILSYGNVRVPCVVGRRGVVRGKREGDGATPAGKFPLRRLLYRPDRLAGIETGLPVRVLTHADAWCDDPRTREYNTLIQLPFPRHAEPLWRQDHLYDVLIVIGYNDDPVVPGRGSAIFLHVAPEGLAGTDGCIAIAFSALLEVARHCTTATVIEVAPA
jgi:L,D-peptidoglycan transpeptidase YkuD (ErfK/YbiS/YcfS/YnhG family)